MRLDAGPGAGSSCFPLPMDAASLSARANAFSIAALMSGDPGMDPAMLSGMGYGPPHGLAGLGMAGMPGVPGGGGVNPGHGGGGGGGGAQRTTDCYYDWGQNGGNAYNPANMPGIKGMEGEARS